MPNNNIINAEQARLDENALKAVPLEHWGPYVSERQWATVREDYSHNGDAWKHFTHDQARSRAYRWGEDGLAGISDYYQRLCFAVALWNGHDPILKERLFGLPNGQGNHGEDVKELYYYLDNVPSHYYMKYLYKYPQQEFPYDELVSINIHRSKHETEYELLDTGIFDNDRYFDVYITYAKNQSEDIQICIEIVNRAAETAEITVLPTLWFYNYWQFDKIKPKPLITKEDNNRVTAAHPTGGVYHFYFDEPDKTLFTENDTNNQRIYRQPNESIYVKDAFHEAIIEKENIDELAAKTTGTKFSPVYQLEIPAKGSRKIFMRLSKEPHENAIGPDFEDLFTLRKKEADDFYNQILPAGISPDLANIQRQAFAGLLWNKQYYHYDTRAWHFTGKTSTPALETRPNRRNNNWKYLNNQDVISMPDKWEYPWYAAWDLAFHCVPMAMIDPVFAKNQLILIMREWYMNPEGQIPAYEWNFSDVNPPVQAWAALQVYNIEKEKKGTGDIKFLKRVFQKLMINFTWWANRKDVEGNNIFAGGFLGLDNIGVFDRSSPIKDAILQQVDGTSWMGTFALNMLDIALEISMYDDAYEDMALKFYEHFVLIAEALNELGLWDSEDQFFYDTLRMENRAPYALKVRSIVGLTSMFAVSVFSYDKLEKLNDFRKRASWLNRYRTQNKLFLPLQDDGIGKVLLSLVPYERLVKLIERICDESEFLSSGGIRALSKYHENNPYTAYINNHHYSIKYEPGDSTSNLFGGNSNWRGPIWMPINFILISSIKKYHEFYGDEVKFPFPGKNGTVQLSLGEIADEISKRLISIFKADASGKRPLHGTQQEFYQKPENADLVLFYEYFHGDNSNGLGASHQTGWSALIANMINDVY